MSILNNSSKRPFYPGWYQVGASTVGTGLSFITIAILCFSVFVRPLQAEFGWQRGEIALALTIATLVQAFVNPFLGAVIDRLGVRRLLLPSILMMSLVVASGYFLTASLWHLYLTYFLITLLGAGTGPVIYSRLLVTWFDRRRGLALGIGLSGIGLGAALVAPLLQNVIDSYGWRVAYLVFAALAFLISLPTAMLLVRDTPADAGLRPDEADAPDDTSGHHAPSVNLTISEAYRTRQYPYLMAAFICLGISIGGIAAHLFPMMLDQGLSTSRASAAAAVFGMSIIVGRVACGFLLDRFYAPAVTALFLSLPGVAIFIFATGVDPVLVYVAAMAIGLGVGAAFDALAFLISRYFGLKVFGKVYGQVYGIFQLGHAIGPISMGIVFDRTGEYTAMLWVCLGLVAIGVGLTAILGEYRRAG